MAEDTAYRALVAAQLGTSAIPTSSSNTKGNNTPRTLSPKTRHRGEGVGVSGVEDAGVLAHKTVKIQEESLTKESFV